MPRVPYEQHRAQKAAAARDEWNRRYQRQGSVVESETDAESLFSNTTYQSHSSIHSPYPRHAYSHHSTLLDPSSASASIRGSMRQRTFSSTSYASSSNHVSPSSLTTELKELREGSSPRATGAVRSSSESSPNSGGLGLHIKLPPPSSTTSTSIERKRSDYLVPPSSISSDVARAERRARRRKEREENSTLRGGKFDSPLRTGIRWLTKNGWGRWSLPLGLGTVMLVKMVSSVFGEGGSGWLGVGEGYGWNDLVGEGIWMGMVVWWIVNEGLKGGRSWRSQVTGIMTILLAPVFTSGNSHRLSHITTILSLNLLSSSRDFLAFSLMVLNFLFDAKSWPYLFTIAVYQAGECLWLGSPSGWAHLLGLVSTAILAKPLLCFLPGTPSSWSATTLGKLSSEILGNAPRLLRAVSTQFDQSGVYSNIEALQQALCQGGSSWSLELLWQHKLKIAISALSIIPAATILLYSSYSLRPSTSETTPRRTRSAAPPTLNLLPLVLFLSSISSVIYSGTSDDVALSLMPLALLIALRGGAARGAEGGGTEDEVWRVGSWLMNLGMIGLVPTSTTSSQVFKSTLLTVVWNWTIGTSNLTSIPIILRQACQVALPQKLLISYIVPIENGLVKSVFALSWIWGLKKLIEGAWAMGGLSGRTKARSK
ncbi:hypothetical protein CI109_102325 [Kwoniella shandongensis]|uniref:Uncharacterized protein n=1 Tax=Kwoniella shandongensis TaxID=1734106 RepID=A0A5M6C098_9TREE|nr:uncharacterized protein CI109_003355 [Kwoniella shandongensis]KAA5528454.1 hypothetical protein CI109_003355 [Kwoniella shandongensis]